VSVCGREREGGSVCVCVCVTVRVSLCVCVYVEGMTFAGGELRAIFCMRLKFQWLSIFRTTAGVPTAESKGCV